MPLRPVQANTETLRSAGGRLGKVELSPAQEDKATGRAWSEAVGRDSVECRLVRRIRNMKTEKIKVRATASGQLLEVTVLSKRLDSIQVVLGEGVHSVRCDLSPTRNGSAYVGSAMGREIVYERSRENVKGDLARAAGYREFNR